MGRKYKSTNYFSPNDSNTYCDVTNFKTKLSQVNRRWEGWRVIDAAFHPRQPQDFPVIPVKQQTFSGVRIENPDTDDVVSFEII